MPENFRLCSIDQIVSVGLLRVSAPVHLFIIVNRDLVLLTHDKSRL